MKLTPILLFLVAAASSALAGERAALLIGNAAYQNGASLPPLDTPPLDVAAMGQALRAAQFDVTVEKNLTTAAMREKVVAYTRAHRDAEALLIYVSSHGVQVDGENYLPGVDADLDTTTAMANLARTFPGMSAEEREGKEREVIRFTAGKQMVPLSVFLDALASTAQGEGRVRMIFLDTCRSPFRGATSKGMLGAKSGGGLAPVSERPGLFIGFAALANQEAQQNEAGHPSLFTEALAAQIRLPGLQLEQVFKRTSREVTERSRALKKQGVIGEEQTPAAYSVLQEDFVFVPEKVLAKADPIPPRLPAIVNPPSPSPSPLTQPSLSSDSADEKTLSEAKIKLTALQQQFRFSEASALAATIHVSSGKGQSEREVLVKKADWLEKFKRALIGDITTTGYAAPIQKRNGATLPAGAHRATEEQIEVTTPFGGISAPWADIASDSILAMAQSFLKINLPQDRLSDRQWYLGVFALQIGKTQEGCNFLTQASQAKEEYRDLLSQAYGSMPELKTPSIASGTLERATFVNSLGMKFVPIPGTRLLFSAWDTRVQDYAEYAREKGITPEKPSFEQGPTHPAVMVSWEDAHGFCAWLSKKEGRTYRLPTDAEWSLAVGPQEYPWGNAYPSPHGAGNYAASLGVDSFANTSPVGTFPANQCGLYDMGGNVWQWCEDQYRASMNSADAIKAVPKLKGEKARDGTPFRVVRGASWFNNVEIYLRSTYRSYDHPTNRSDRIGFRCVLVISGG
jgi:hypothetical protein